jgi:hypothetical protein
MHSCAVAIRQISERWLRHVWFLKDAEDGFMVQLALNLQAAVFAPHEQPPVGNLYIVHRGLAIYNGKVLSQGKVWGEDMIITNEKFRTEATAWAITYLDVMTISRNDFMDLALTFPPSMKAIRIAAYKMSFSREIILRCALQKSPCASPVPRRKLRSRAARIGLLLQSPSCPSLDVPRLLSCCCFIVTFLSLPCRSIRRRDEGWGVHPLAQCAVGRLGPRLRQHGHGQLG